MSSPQSGPAPMPSQWHVFLSALAPELLNGLQPSPPPSAYTPWVVTWLLIYQRLHNNATLSDAVAHFILEFPDHARPDCKRCREHTLSANTGAYSQARSALEGAVLSTAHQRVFDTRVAAYPPSGHARRVFILDGTTLTLPPTEQLTTAFPPASNRRGNSHWPVMHVVCAHERSSGLAAAPQYGPMYGPAAQSEVDLAVRVLDALPARSIVLADRNFGVFALVFAARLAGQDTVVRLTEARFRALKKKGTPVEPGLWSLDWKPSPHDRKAHRELPEEAMVGGWLHEVRVRTDRTLWLWSTVEGRGAELAQLYARRADVETDIRDLKVALELDALRGPDESVVGKELWVSLVAYNLTTQVRRLPAARVGVSPRRLSSAGVWSLARVFMSSRHADEPESQTHARFDRLLRAAGQRKLPQRKPGRSYPRAVHTRRRKFPEHKRVTPPPT